MIWLLAADNSALKIIISDPNMETHFLPQLYTNNFFIQMAFAEQTEKLSTTYLSLWISSFAVANCILVESRSWLQQNQIEITELKANTKLQSSGIAQHRFN